MKHLTSSGKVHRYVVEVGTPITYRFSETGESLSGPSPKRYQFDDIHPKVETQGDRTCYVFDGPGAQLVVDRRHVVELQLTTDVFKAVPPWTGFSDHRRAA